MAEQITYTHLPDDPCLTQEQLFAYIDDKLTPAERHKAEHHLLDCPMCSDALEGLLQVSDRKKVAAFIPFSNSAGESISREEKKEEPKIIPLYAQPKAWLTMAASIVILTGVTVAFRMLLEKNGEAQKNKTAQTISDSEENRIFDSIAAHTQPAPPNDDPKMDSMLRRSGGSPENLSSLDSFKGNGEIVDKAPLRPATGANIYSWDQKAGQTANTSGNAGNYKVTATDANACCAGSSTTLTSADAKQKNVANNLSTGLPSFYQTQTTVSNSAAASGASSDDLAGVSSRASTTKDEANAKKTADNLKSAHAYSRGNVAVNKMSPPADTARSGAIVMEDNTPLAGKDNNKKQDLKTQDNDQAVQQSVSHSNNAASGPPATANSNIDIVAVPKTDADAQTSTYFDNSDSTSVVMQKAQQADYHPLATKPSDADLTFDYNKGVQLMASGNYSAAIPLFDHVLAYSTASHFEDAQWQKAQSLLKLGKKDDAKKLLQVIVSNKQGKYFQKATDQLKTL